MKDSVVFLLLLFFSAFAVGQSLQPGFDQNEYLDLMKLSAQFGDSAYRSTIPVPPRYTLTYRSEVMGLDNRWDLWAKDDSSSERVAIISVRGTTERSESWLANFYAAMAKNSS